MKTPHQFYLETNGRIIDVDKSYGGQCWDLWAYFCDEWIGKHWGNLPTKYVIDLWTYFDKFKLGEYFEKVYRWQDFQDGDWVIWQGPCQITQHSHIAMFRKDEAGTGGGIFLTQNPNGNPNYTHQMWISYNNYVGAIRPKCYIKGDTTPLKITKCEIETHPENKSVKVIWEAINGTPNYAKYILNGVEYGLNIDNIIPNLELDKEYKFQLELRKAENNLWTTSDEQTFIIENPKEPPQEEKGGDNTNIPSKPKTPEIAPKEEKKDSIFICILKLIVSIIKKIDRR